MMTYPFPLTDVISQIKAYIFSVSMENQAVRLFYLSQTNNANQKQPQNNQFQVLHFLQCQDKMQKMKTCKLKLVFTSAGLFLPPHVWLCLWSYRCLSMFSVHALQKRKHAKTSHNLNCSKHVIYKVTMPVHNFKLNVDKTFYRKDAHQNQSIRLRKIKLGFMSECHIFVMLLSSAQKSYAPICLNYICPTFFLILQKFSFPYCLWFYCLCLGPLRTNDERKGNTTANSNGKKVCAIPNKRLGKCSSEMLQIRVEIFLKCTFLYMLPFTNKVSKKYVYIYFTAFPLIKKILTIVLLYLHVSLTLAAHLPLLLGSANYLLSYLLNCSFSYMRLFVKAKTAE